LARTRLAATQPLLDFRLACRARDAVHEPLDQARLAADLAELGPRWLTVASWGGSPSYLMRPISAAR